eukprot:1147766-Pelagomonas_calceolata.AAC.2
METPVALRLEPAVEEASWPLHVSALAVQFVAFGLQGVQLSLCSDIPALSRKGRAIALRVHGCMSAWAWNSKDARACVCRSHCTEAWACKSKEKEGKSKDAQACVYVAAIVLKLGPGNARKSKGRARMPKHLCALQSFYLSPSAAGQGATLCHCVQQYGWNPGVLLWCSSNTHVLVL